MATTPNTMNAITTTRMRRWTTTSVWDTATLTFTRGEFFMCALTRNGEAKRLPHMGEARRFLVLGRYAPRWDARARPLLLVPAEDRRDLHRQQDSHADDSEPDQHHTHHQLDELIALFAFL